jgi:hypothetical protein
MIIHRIGWTTIPRTAAITTMTTAITRSTSTHESIPILQAAHPKTCAATIFFQSRRERQSSAAKMTLTKDTTKPMTTPPYRYWT